jgi:uncharacterized protein YecE (DUF72 family)
VKAPKAVTHDARLQGVRESLDSFVEQLHPLGDRLGPVLLQLPPNLPFDADAIATACDPFRKAGVSVVCEPRHASWFDAPADKHLRDLRVARVAADPARHPGADNPGGWRGMSYYRLHGSPRMYYSAYGAEAVAGLADRLKADPAETVWCVFDNTASGAAAADALALEALLRTKRLRA